MEKGGAFDAEATPGVNREFKCAIGANRRCFLSNGARPLPGEGNYPSMKLGPHAGASDMDKKMKNRRLMQQLGRTIRVAR